MSVPRSRPARASAVTARAAATDLGRGADPAGAEGPRDALGAIRVGVWGPVLSRLVAGALALLGLAAIGLAARRSPELVTLVAPSAPLDVASLSGSGLPPAPDPSSPPAAAPGAPGVGAAVRADTGSAAPCVPASPAVPRPAAAELVPPRSSFAAASPGPGSETAPVPSTGEGGHARPGAPAAASDEHRVALNSADENELRKLPGVGAKRAAAIVELRRRLGGFRQLSDLLRIRGIGRRTLKRMAPRLVLDPPRGAPPTPIPVSPALSSVPQPRPRAGGH